MAREDLHFRLRIPEDLKRKIEAEAASKGVSMTAEIVGRLEKSFDVAVPLPPELAERVRLYAERHQRTIDEEIVRLLEREYPQQWDVDERMEYLGELLSILQGGTADPRIDQYIRDVRDTVQGILTGRVKGVSRVARDEIQSLWDQYQERLAEDAQDEDYDEEEIEARSITGYPEKMAEPIPNPHQDRMYLDDLLPANIMAELTRNLRKADVDAALATLGRLTKPELQKYIQEQALPIFERKWFTDRYEEPHSDSEDPFSKDV